MELTQPQDWRIFHVHPKLNLLFLSAQFVTSLPPFFTHLLFSFLSCFIPLPLPSLSPSSPSLHPAPFWFPSPLPPSSFSFLFLFIPSTLSFSHYTVAIVGRCRSKLICKYRRQGKAWRNSTRNMLNTRPRYIPESLNISIIDTPTTLRAWRLVTKVECRSFKF